MNSSDNLPYAVAPDEKVAQLMLYTSTGLYWGEFVAKESIRVSTILRTSVAPEVICLHNARSLMSSQSGKPRPQIHSEIHIFTPQVLAYHLLPPQQDPLDYDPTEPNRLMDPVTIQVGSFCLNGHMRISTISSLGKYLEVTREAFTPVYDVEITNSSLPDMGAMKVSYVLVRQNSVVFTKKAV